MKWPCDVVGKNNIWTGNKKTLTVDEKIYFGAEWGNYQFCGVESVIEFMCYVYKNVYHAKYYSKLYCVLNNGLYLIIGIK